MFTNLRIKHKLNASTRSYSLLNFTVWPSVILRRYEIINEISLKFPQWFIIGKHTEIRFKNNSSCSAPGGFLRCILYCVCD